MTERVFLEEHSTFEGASRRARELARLTALPASVRPRSFCWVVMARGVPEPTSSTGDGDDAVVAEPVDDGEMALVTQEISEAQDDWARSEEDGWFYED